MNNDDVRLMLFAWFAWSGDHQIIKNYPNMTPFARLMKREFRQSRYISDEDAMAVDAMLAKLKSRDKEVHDAILVYAATRRYDATARYLNVNRQRATLLVSTGLAWLDASLFNKL